MWGKVNCDPFTGICRAYISTRPVPPRVQQTPVWCWAASMSMIFAYYGHQVDQSTIVSRFYGAAVPIAGDPLAMDVGFNSQWIDTSGRSFRVTSKITDLYRGTSFQVSNIDIVAALTQEKPVFYCDQTHAMVLVQVDYINTPSGVDILAGGVIDPWPASFGFRALDPNQGELAGSYVAISDVTDVSQVTISSVVDIMGQTNHLTSGEWMTIYGTGLSNTKREWGLSDFKGASLPTTLDGVKVVVNGRSAYIGYVSPNQVNFLTPVDSGTGSVSVTITNPNGSTAQAIVTKQTFSPAFFRFTTPTTNQYAIATFKDGSYAGPVNLLGANVNVHPAKASDVLAFWMSGLGPTSPMYSDGKLVTSNAQLTSTLQIRIGGILATLDWAGIVGAGLYQVNAHVPAGLSGDVPVQVSIGGITTQVPTYINVTK